MFARMETIKLGNLDEDGKSINDVETALKRVGIALRDSSGQFRNMDDVIVEVANKWNSLNTIEQSAIAQAIAGQRQRENFLVLMNNFNDTLKYQETEASSAGLAMQRYGIYMQGIEATTNRFSDAWQKLWQKFLSSDFLISIVNMGTQVLDLIDKAGGLETVIRRILEVLILWKSMTIGNGITSFFNMFVAGGPLAGGVEAIAGKMLTLIWNIGKSGNAIKGLTSTFSAGSIAAGVYAAAIIAVIEAINQYNTQVVQQNKKGQEDTNNAFTTEFDKISQNKGSGVENYLAKFGQAVDGMKQQLAQADPVAKLFVDDNKLFLEGLKSLSPYLQKSSSSFGEYKNAMDQAAKKAGYLVDEQGKYYKEVLIGYGQTTRQYVDDLNNMVGESEKAMNNLKTDRDSFADNKMGKASETSTSAEPSFDYGSLGKQSKKLQDLTDNYAALTEAVQKYGADSSQALQALTAVLGDNVDATKYLTEDGKVDFDALNATLKENIRDLLDYADQIQSVMPDEAAAIRNIANQAMAGMQQVTVEGYSMSQTAFAGFADSASSAIWQVADNSNVALVALDGTVMTSSQNIQTAVMANLANYEFFLEQLSAKGIAAMSNLQGFLSQQAAFSSGATPYQPTFTMPSGGGGGGGGESAESKAQKAALDGEIDALQKKKDALQKQLDAYKDWIETQKKSLKLQKEEKEYTEDLLEKETDLAKTKARIALLSLDDSEEAQAKRIELEEDAAKQEKDIEKDKSDRIYDLQTQALDDAEAKYEAKIKKQMDAISGTIDGYKSEKDAIDNAAKATGGASGATQQYGVVSEAVMKGIIQNFINQNSLTDEAKQKLWEMGQGWVDQKLLIRDAYNELLKYKDLLDKTNTSKDNANGGSKGITEHQGGIVPESHHHGDFAGGLKSNEVFAKLLKGEYVATQSQMDNFMGHILPMIAGSRIPEYSSLGSGDISVEMPIHVAGNLDKSVIPDIKEIAKEVIGEINKSLSRRGNVRSANQTVS